MHLENYFYFVRDGLNALGGNHTTQHFASCYPEDAFLWVEIEFGFMHICKSFHEIRDDRSFLLACYYNIINVREYIPIDLVL
jgi:hypothetical protein